MRVYFVNRFYAPDHSATSQMLSDLATHLAKIGTRVTVVTSRLRYDHPAAKLPPRESMEGVSVRRMPSSRFGRHGFLGRAMDYLSFQLSATLFVMRHARAGDVVVAMTDPPLVSVSVGWAARNRGASSVNWLHDLFPEVASELGVRILQGPLSRLLAWLRNRSLRAAASNVVLSDSMRKRILALEVDPKSLAVIPNWADGAELRAIGRSPNQLRREWSLDGKFVVGYSGNMGRAHDFETIMEAAHVLRDETDVAFLFVGGGSQARRIAGEARSLPNVILKPYQPRSLLAQSLSAADVHLVSLRPQLEGLVVPSKFYGIAAVGRPTIFLGDCDGEIARLVKQNDCGFAIAAGDVNGLVARITELRDLTALRERLGHNARRLFDERYDSRIAFESWRKLLRAVMRP